MNSPVTVTLHFSTLALAAQTLLKLDAGTAVVHVAAPAARIDPLDEPDAGVDMTPATQIFGGASQLPATAVFGGAAVPPGPLAPSTAGVDPSPTVPVVPPAGPLTGTPGTLPLVPNPAATAGAPAGPAGPTNPVGIVLDADGLPWDERIHANSADGKPKPTNADGRWRQKRGLNNAPFKKQVEDELRRAMAAGVPQAAAPVQQPLVPPPVASPTPPPPAVQQPQMPPPAAAPLRFPAFMLRVQPLLMSGQLPMETLNAALKTVGLDAITQLMQRDDLVPYVEQALAPIIGAPA